MIKREIKETVTEYDKDGSIIKVTTKEITEEDDSVSPYTERNPLWYDCLSNCKKEENVK